MNIMVRLTDPMVLGWFRDHPEISAPRFIGESIRRKYRLDTPPVKGRRKNKSKNALLVYLTDGSITSFLKDRKMSDGLIIKHVVETALKEAIEKEVMNGGSN